MSFLIYLSINVEKITIRIKKNVDNELKFNDNNKLKNDEKLTLLF